MLSKAIAKSKGKLIANASKSNKIIVARRSWKTNNFIGSNREKTHISLQYLKNYQLTSANKKKYFAIQISHLKPNTGTGPLKFSR